MSPVLRFGYVGPLIQRLASAGRSFGKHGATRTLVCPIRGISALSVCKLLPFRQFFYRSSVMFHLFSTPPLKIFKRDGVLIFESKRKATVVLTPPSGRMPPVLLFAFQALASLVILVTLCVIERVARQRSSGGQGDRFSAAKPTLAL